MKIVLVPLFGALHLTYPQYNAVTVQDVIKKHVPCALVTTALLPNFAENLRWQDTEEIALPLAVVPWAITTGLSVHGVHVASPDAAAYEDFQRYLQEYQHVETAWDEVSSLETNLQTLLAQPLTLPRIVAEVLPLVADYVKKKKAVAGDGPATDWLELRTKKMAEIVLELIQKYPSEQTLVVLASSEHIPFLEQELQEKADQKTTVSIADEAPPASAAAQERALLDAAFVHGSQENILQNPAELIKQLQAIGSPEARFHEANIRLQYGQLEDAITCLTYASQQDFHTPYFLPGYLLTRLGQLQDAAGNRSAAIRAYKGACALSYVPQDARVAAEAGLKKPFKFPES